MNSKTILVLSLTAACFVPAARADVDVSINADIRLGRALPPPPPEVIVGERIGPDAPPPWRTRHWYRRDYAYYYYPGCDVYFRPSDHMWFYLDGPNWHAAARLPDSVTIDFGRSVSLTLETDRPYTYNERIIAYYPRDYFAKVKFKNGHDNRVDRREDRRDNRQDRRVDRRDDRKDNGKGKAKNKPDHR